MGAESTSGPLPPQPPAPPLPSTKRSWVPRLAVIGAVGAIAVGAAVVLGGDDGSSYPAEWDERVVDLVAFVEDERGHRFDHPVHVDFLTEAEYADRTRSDESELSEEDRADLEQAESLFRALGLADGDLDLFESNNDLADAGTLAFYDPVTERVTVRGTEVTPALSVTLVHELTHVLQDQRFDLERIADEEATSGEQLAYRALAEGDAGRIEEAYLTDELTEAEQEEVAAENEEGLGELEEEEVPEALSGFFALPYVLGDGFVLALGDNDAVDDAFEEPPSSEEHVLHPASYLSAGEPDEPKPVSIEAPDGAEVLDEGDFGAASLMLVLGSRLEPRQALDAAIGWGGDAYVSYELDDQVCVDVAVTGDDAAETAELLVALTAWAAAGPAGAAEVADDSGEITLHACDPEGDGVAPRSAFDTLAIAGVRNAVVGAAMENGADGDFAECYADAVLDVFSVEELTGEVTPPDFDARIAQAAQSCS